MNKFDFTKNGGLRFTQEVLDFMQSSYSEGITALGKAFGNYVILDGCTVSAGVVSDGWILVNGEPIKFLSSNLDTKVAINIATQDVTFKNGLPYPVKQIKTANCNAVGAFDFSLLKRLNDYATMQQQLANHIANTWRVGDIKEVDCDAAYILANFNSTGLGINERVGWAVCNGNNGTKNRQGRTSIGMYYPNVITNPNDNVWDILYNTIGSTVGGNKHQLIKGELPTNNIPVHQNVAGVTAAGGSGSQPWSPSNVNFGGDDLPHENRQPSIVTLIIQKI
jgi:hypothetical protein